MGFFVRIYMRVCKKMVIYLGIKRKYTWEKTASISCHNFETNGRPYVGTWDLGMRDEGLEDTNYGTGTGGKGTRGSQIQGRRGRGM